MRRKIKPSDNIQIGSKKRKIKSCTFLCTLMLLSAFAAGCGASGDDSTTAAEKADTKTTVTTGPTPTLSPMPLNQMRFVAIDEVNIRSEANDKSDVIGSFSKGNVVNVLSEDGDWYKVSYFGDDGEEMTGYASKQFVNQVHSLT